MDWTQFDAMIGAALEEDGAARDVTTAALVPADAVCWATMIVREEGVVCGLSLAARVCAVFDPRLAFEAACEDGSAAAAGTAVARLGGPAAAILSVERTMLNFVQRLSGVATLTRRFVEAVQGTETAILDTRKTTPGWRALEKYAVRCGGGENHRMGLHDMVLIKDNHLRMAGNGGVEGAIRAARERAGGLPVEVEVETMEELCEALKAAPDFVLLDNMSPGQVREAARRVRAECPEGGRPLLEASGGITLQNVRAYAEAGADRISLGAITHSAPALDVSLEIERS